MWLPVQSYENEYEINRKGDVRRKGGSNPLKFSVGKHGYPVVSLWKNNKGITHTIHRLLAVHFIPNHNNLPTVNHIDGNKENFDLSNLEWASYSKNNKHAYDSGLKIVSQTVINSSRERALKRNFGNSFRSLPIEVYDLNDKLIAVFPSIKEASESLGVNRSGILRILKGQIKNPKYYKYKLKEA